LQLPDPTDQSADMFCCILNHFTLS